MRILYDGQIHATQPMGGISRYFANLISRLPEGDRPTLFSVHYPGLSYPSNPNLKVLRFKRFRVTPLSYALEAAYFRFWSARNHFDLLHPTYYSLLGQRRLQEYSAPIVTTVHDMTHERLPELFAPGDPIPENKRQSILAAQAILCVSENTKRDLLEFYSIPEEKITVTPLASELDLSLSYGEEATPPQPYFLYVGSRVQYKNFGVLLKAFAKVCSLNSEVQLGVVGSALTPEEIQQINELQLTDRIVLFQKVSDRHLAKLYRCSMALVYPSLYEGFGIPLLEAMACGTAVVAANSSSIPEVVGDAGILFEPTAVGELADRLLHLLEYPAERDRLIQKGNNRVRQFSWNRTAAQTFAVYRSLVE